MNAPTNPRNKTLDAYRTTLDERGGFIHEDSALRSRRSRMPLAAVIVSLLTVATFAGGIGYAIGAAL